MPISTRTLSLVAIRRINLRALCPEFREGENAIDGMALIATHQQPVEIYYDFVMLASKLDVP